ncbi:DUF5667 domain-containing protein [Nocardioides currus]|uniref:DUF5667 domain-containing protein n=1 Tax=Nocardioides currus TaxID=2133958 RepID=A0A2R7Z244_9ACTN|nr:DUF5667 domain-containing protein [Nocardioides currus]PUA82701.1 hypothetical protein C7S10_02970 [Nocardioides currus]
MTGPFSARRRAEEFDAALSRPLTEQDATQFADLLAVVRDLRAVPEPTARPEFVGDLRERLMAEADTALLPQSARPLTAVEQRLVLPVRTTPRDRRLATVLGAAALIGATTSVAVAAQTALPGESLYTVKRAIEDARTGIARDDAAKGRAMLANARDRLGEVRALADRGDPASLGVLGSTLDAFTEQAADASDVLLASYAETGDEAVVSELRTFTATSMDELSALESTLPASEREDLVTAGRRLADIDLQTSQACPACTGDVTSIPHNLLSAEKLTGGVTTVIVAASQDPGLLKPVKVVKPDPVTPDPVSGQDTDGVEVPDLEVPDPTTAAPTPTPTPTGKPTSPVKVDVKKPVNDATKLLTGDLTTVVDGVPVVDDVLTGVGTTLDGTVDGVQGTLDGVTGSLLP